MKKLTKQTISSALLIALLASLASCGGSASTGDTTTAASVDTTTAADVTDIYSSIPEMDFGGAEINILSYGTSWESRSEFLFAEQTGDPVDDALFKRNIDTESRLNVKLVYSSELGENDARALFEQNVLAGDTTYDTFAFKSYALGTIFTKGILRDWDDIEGMNLEEPWYVQDVNDTYTIGNKHYIICSDALGTNMTCAWAMVFNKRLADEFGVSGIYDIVRSGGWTVDKLIELTKDVWIDVNGNSERDEPDTYGLYLDVGGPLDALMLTQGVYALKKDANDYPTIDFYSETLVESFEKSYELLWENPGTYIIQDTKQFYSYIKNFAAGQGLFSPMFIQYLFEGDMRDMEDEYGVIPFPKLNDDQQEYFTYTLPRNGGFMLPKTLTSDKAEMIGYVVETLSAYSHKYLRPAIYEVSLSEKGVRDEESVEMLELVLDARKYDFVSALQMGGSFQFTQDKTYRNLLSKQNKDITSYYESNKSAAEKYIEDLVKVFEENE